VAAPSDIQILVTPYGWIPWVPVSVKPSNPRIPSSSVTIDPYELVSHLTWVPFMGAVEFRDGPVGLALDYIHAPLKAGISTRGILFGGGTGGIGIDAGTAMVFYRPIAEPDQYLDLGVGVRAWGFAGDISLDQGRLLPAVSVSNGVSWADPLIALRYHHDLGNGFGATVYGDLGGFGLGAHVDWQVMGTIDYALESWIDLHAGFRSMNFNYSLPRAGLNVGLNGPIFSATFRF
jgi:hypothetical protein